jgi:hypothetical protein
LCPDIEPIADSKIGSGTPEASSAISRTYSLWIPCRASGVSGRAVRNDAKLSLGAAISTIRSLLMSYRSSSAFGSFRPQDFTSASSASLSWAPVGAVHAVFCGNRVSRWHQISHDSRQVLPGP